MNLTSKRIIDVRRLNNSRIIDLYRTSTNLLKSASTEAKRGSDDLLRMVVILTQSTIEYSIRLACGNLYFAENGPSNTGENSDPYITIEDKNPNYSLRPMLKPSEFFPALNIPREIYSDLLPHMDGLWLYRHKITCVCGFIDDYNAMLYDMTDVDLQIVNVWSSAADVFVGRLINHIEKSQSNSENGIDSSSISESEQALMTAIEQFNEVREIWE